MMLFWIGGYSQNFYTTNNIVLEEIPETEYRSSYQSKSKSVSKWKNKGRKYKRIVKGFLDSDIARELYISEESAETGKLNIRIKKLKSKRYDESYIIQETATVGSKAYYMKWAIPDTMAMFGIGDIDNEQIYYACPDYDCDQHVWCRWYSFADGRVSIAAELKDKFIEAELKLRQQQELKLRRDLKSQCRGSKCSCFHNLIDYRFSMDQIRSFLNYTKERAKLSIARGIAGNLGGMPVLAVKALSFKTEEGASVVKWGPLIIGVGILGVLSIVFMLLCYKGSKERWTPQPAPREKGAFKKSINRIIHNRAMLSICKIAILLAGGSMFGAVISVFVSTDFFNMSGFNTGLPDILNIGGIFLTMFFVPPMAKKFGKKEATTMGALFCVAIYILQLCIFWLPHQTEVYPYYLYVLCNFLSGLGSGFFNCLLWGMVGDAIDDIYIKTGIREDGTSYSILMFFRKVGQTVAFCGGQGILIAIGYVSGVKLNQSQLTMFWFLSNGIPLVCFAVAVILFIFWYPINKHRLEDIQDAKELMLQKEEKSLKVKKPAKLVKAK